MRTNIVLDDELVKEALALTHVGSKRQLVDMALRELVRARKKKNLLDLSGKLDFRSDYDHKAMRAMRDGAG